MAPDLRTRAERRLRDLLLRGRLLVQRPPVPDWPTPADDPRRRWLRQLDRTRATLELAREGFETDGWVGGGWFAIPTDHGVRLADRAEAYAVLRSGAPAAGACLVGGLLRLAEDPDRATTVTDVRHSVDELHEALHESMGHTAAPGGRTYPLAAQRAHLQTLTAWNDEPGRRHEDVVTLIDRAVARTIVAACA